MRTAHLLSGLTAGIVLGIGGAFAADVVTSDASAQGPTADRDQQRVVRSIKQGVLAWNLVAKYAAEPGQLVSVQSPRNIRQDRGLGGGFPTELIADGAITEPKLSPALQARINAGGPPGPAGAPGPAGPPGPQGTAGEVPATFAEGPVGMGFPTPPLDGNFNVILNSNGSVPGTRSGGVLTFDEPKRVSAHGWVEVMNAGMDPLEVRCFPAARSFPGPSTRPIGIPSEFRVLNATTAQIALSGSADLDPAEYQILLICQTADTTDNLTAERATVSAIVTDQ